MKLSEAIHRYVEWKRFCGRPFETGEKTLLGFLRFVGDIELADLSKRHICSYVRLHEKHVRPLRNKYYSVLALFVRHWSLRGEIRAIRLPRPRATNRDVLLPHIYSRVQIRRLLNNIESNQRSLNCMVDGRTVRAFLLFLYGTGAYVGEALRLKNSDVDLELGTIKLRRIAGARERTLPLGRHLHQILRDYRSALPESYRASEMFFVDKLGKRLNPTTVAKTYQKLRRRASIYRTDGFRVQPRLHDFRHTFAVHTLTAWLNRGKDLRRMLPALSAYLGFVRFATAERYLRMIPERFRPQLKALISPRI